MEFLRDGSWKSTNAGTLVGRGNYVRTDEFAVKLTQDGAPDATEWRIKVDGDVLQTTNEHETDKWFRVAVPDVTATAPKLMIDNSDLGRPCDANFRIIGTPLYRKREGAATSRTSHHGFLQVTDTTTLQANAHGWGIGGSVEEHKEKRYQRYRAYQQEEVFKVDDDGAPLNEPPPNAEWYVAVIIWGRSVEVVTSGDKSNFHAGVEAELKVVGASLSSISERNKLTLDFKGRGIKGVKADAVFAKTFDEIKAAYEQDAPVPIEVVYRHIPGAPAPTTESILWGVPDDIQVDPIPVKCYCAVNQQVGIVCRVHNRGGRSMDVTVRGHATTGWFDAQADQVSGVRVAPGKSEVVTIAAQIRNAKGFNCKSTNECTCTKTDARPNQ